MATTIEGSTPMADSRVAFASDYDGTLVHPGNVIRSGDVEAVRGFQAAGGLFGACSGRAINAVLGPAERAGIKLDFAVASSGALVIARGQVMEDHPVDEEVARNIASEFQGVWMALHTRTRLLVETDPTTPYQTRVDSLSLPIDEPIYSISINFGDEPRAAKAVRAIKTRYGRLVEPFQNVGSVDVVTCGCSKGHGIDVVRHALTVDVMGGIGDSYNDVPLLEAVDVSYTFTQAPAAVRAYADGLVGSVAEALADYEHRFQV